MLIRLTNASSGTYCLLDPDLIAYGEPAPEGNLLLKLKGGPDLLVKDRLGEVLEAANRSGVTHEED